MVRHWLKSGKALTVLHGVGIGLFLLVFAWQTGSTEPQAYKDDAQQSKELAATPESLR